MKRYLKYIGIILFSLVVIQAQSQVCCPKFTLGADFEPCDSSCTVPGPNGGGNPSVPGGIIIACKNQTHTYTVYPNLPLTYSYTWSVLGGGPASFVGNPNVITWGAGNQGFIQVIITDIATGTCRDTIRRQVCLVDGPTASFTFAPNPVCLSPSVAQFTSTSTGASSFYWEFGDGGTSTLQNPTHAYLSPGVYVVTLTVATAAAGGGGAGQQPERDCHCKDTAKATITVSSNPGIDIHTDDCRKMLCTGDTVKYCTNTTGCTGLVWSVAGGSIIGPTNTNCVTVVWNQPSAWPTSVTLNANCPNTCGNTATLNVPVLYPNLPIQGPSPVCQGSTASYYLPVLPGTFYKWTLSGGGNIIGPDSNTAVININWTAPGGSYQIICNYNNPYSGCSGADTITVTIRPPFRIQGPTPVCTTQSYNYFTNGPALTWTFTPPTGFTNTPVGSNQQTMVWSVPGNYAITATPQVPGNFCTPSATINIVVNPTPVVNPIVGPNPICPNQLINYSVTSNVTGLFTWTLTGGGTASGYGPNNSNASVNFTGAGPWQLKASQTVHGCTGSYTLNITKVGPPPPITLSPATVCSGGSVTASVTGIAPPGGYTWSATPGAVLTGAQGGTSTTFTVNSNATITITSCGGSTSINVTVTPATVTIVPTPGPCNITLVASPGGGTYAWFLNGNPAGGPGGSVTTNQNGNWVVQATYAGGCVATAQYTVSGITPVNANITAIGSLCNGGSVTLTAGIPANCPTPVFTWSNGFVGNPLVTNVPGSYFVTVSCSNGCSAVSNTIPVLPCGGGNGNGNGNCINDLVINPSNCNNPVTLTVASIPSGCSINTIAWDYGDGWGDATGIHLYNNVGTYTVNAVMTCGNGTVHCGTRNITIPMVDSFTSVISCGINGWSVQLQDASLYLPSYAGYSTVWTTTCGSLSNPTIPNPILTVPMGCNPTVTLTISMLGCTLTKSFTFSFPNTAFTINGPSPACQNVINSYSSSYTTGVISYNWTFGDIPPTTGVTNPISHAFTGTPPNPTIGLTIKDQYGCIFSTSITVAVIIPRALNITPGPIIKICPDCAPPVTLSTTPLAGWTGYQWYHNGVAIGGANASTYVLCNFDASGNYYVKANDALNNNCPVTSDTVQVIYNPKPIADIQGQTIWCSGTLPGNIFLTNSITDPNTTYVWTATGPGTVTFSPDNLQSYASVTASAYGTYQFILTATDINTGCIAKDTFCVFLYIAPSAVVNGPAGILCEGTPYTFTCVATPTNPNYVYVWSNGATGQTMTTSQAGTYFVTVTNPTSGCSTMAMGPTIHPRPNVSLFPIGCDTMCLKDTLVPPLPLGPGQTYGSQYTIKWYVDNNLYYTGPFLVLSGLALGPHTIYIVVTTIPWGCSSTSGVFNVFIDPCADCDCKESKWGDIIMTQGNNPPVKLKCNSNYNLICNLPYSINASYICKDSTCSKKVTYVLYPPTGSPIAGNVPLNFTPVAGVYVLTLYGWCGDKKCDSCTIDLTVKCDCDCKGSKWGPITVANTDDGGNGGKAIIANPLTVSCGKTYDLNCNKPYTINASYLCKDSACNGKVTFSLQPPTGLPITGTLPFTFTPNQTGTYILTLYGWCGTKICDSCVIKFKVKCDPCNCDGSHWGDIILNGGDNGGNHDGDPKNAVGNVVIGNPIGLKCNNTYDLVCNKPYTVNANFICKDTNCNGKVTYSLKPPTGLPITGTLALTFTPNQTGTYVLTLYGWCGTKICDSCVIKFNVKCDPCNCDGSHWGDITLDGGELGHTDVPNNPVGVSVIGNPGTAVAIKCKNTYDLVCNKPYTINASFICNDPKCPGKVTYSLQPPTGLPITGTVPLTFTPNQNGTYVLTLYGWCGTKICDSCVIKFNVKCDPCKCDGSKWGDIILNGGDNGGGHGDNPNNPIGNVVIGNPGNQIALTCKKSYTINCNQPYTVNATYICKDTNCNGNVTYKLQPPTGLPITGNLALTFTPTQTGTYTLTLYGWCGNKICDSCVITFKTTCCDCKGSKWAEIFVNDGAKQTFLNCGKTYDWKCKVPFTLNAVYSCVPANCNGSVGYTFTPAIGAPTSGNLPFTYTPTVSGNYTIELYGKCGGKICDTCKIVFRVDCPKDTNCCKHDIKVQAGNVTYTPNTNSTIVGQTFTITGLSGVNLSEVRAEVLSYDLSSNFNNECLGCKTLPFTWASINSAGNIGVVPPQITMYGTTTAVFSPTGAAVYQNPREVTWNNGNLFTITGPLGINFILPPTPTLDCCELSGRICVKFTFRDENCYECEAVVCFNVKIKK